ncbi:putative DsbA family dithiol-disulfide isomerase [Planomicrobium stackebrandtii]|uniref:DsbA family dithiol-disulfide isomerase n=1 Tax=Planomicrobium stackebrandtii TaxID=253160 RepID=A0ABU0GWD8_9BACL|nr:DsbA family oxidoreductase [Planomicrobium stackebrandtii]MDQ0429628.1 putative DsbA family dithiol-disulfide isomerase [Planomicrobium stackebrandtii]
MKIEVWSDYVCPFCYIGKRTLEKALVQSGFESQAEVSFKAYQLDPNTPTDSVVSTYESLAKKFGKTMEQAKEMTEGVAQHARSVGLEYDFDNMMEANTLAAHRLAKWAETKDKDAELTEQLMHQYFVEAKNVSNHRVLLNIVEAVGLSSNEAEQVLESDQFMAEVQLDIAEAGQIGVQGVPFFVINRKYAISGAQPLEAFVESLEQIAEEEGIRPKLKPMGKKKTSYCTGDSCDGL